MRAPRMYPRRSRHGTATPARRTGAYGRVSRAMALTMGAAALAFAGSSSAAAAAIGTGTGSIGAPTVTRLMLTDHYAVVWFSGTGRHTSGPLRDDFACNGLLIVDEKAGTAVERCSGASHGTLAGCGPYRGSFTSMVHGRLRKGGDVVGDGVMGRTGEPTAMGIDIMRVTAPDHSATSIAERFHRDGAQFTYTARYSCGA
jgi:hypothetical protein